MVCFSSQGILAGSDLVWSVLVVIRVKTREDALLVKQLSFFKINLYHPSLLTVFISGTFLIINLLGFTVIGCVLLLISYRSSFQN